MQHPTPCRTQTSTAAPTRKTFSRAQHQTLGPLNVFPSTSASNPADSFLSWLAAPMQSPPPSQTQQQTHLLRVLQQQQESRARSELVFQKQRQRQHTQPQTPFASMYNTNRPQHVVPARRASEDQGSRPSSAASSGSPSKKLPHASVRTRPALQRSKTGSYYSQK